MPWPSSNVEQHTKTSYPLKPFQSVMIWRNCLFILCSFVVSSCHHSEHLERHDLSLMQANTIRNWYMSETLYALVPGTFASVPAETGSAVVPLDSSRVVNNLLPIAARHTQFSGYSQTKTKENHLKVVDEEQNKDLQVNEFTFIPFVVLGSVFLFGFLVIILVVRLYKEPY